MSRKKRISAALVIVQMMCGWSADWPTRVPAEVVLLKESMPSRDRILQISNYGCRPFLSIISGTLRNLAKDNDSGTHLSHSGSTLPCRRNNSSTTPRSPIRRCYLKHRPSLRHSNCLRVKFNVCADSPLRSAVFCVRSASRVWRCDGLGAAYYDYRTYPWL